MINGKLRELRIVGVALSPEFVYAIRPGALADDPKRYAALWMTQGRAGRGVPARAARSTTRRCACSRASAETAVLADIDRILAPYGGRGAIGRKDQTSNKILTGELGQLAALAGMVPPCSSPWRRS